MLEVKGLHKRYGDLVAVQEVSFTAHPGEAVGLLGPNGAGKTTTVSMIAGLLEGAVLTETVFSWPGLGQYLTGSLLNADMNAVLGATVVVGLTYVPALTLGPIVESLS